MTDLKQYSVADLFLKASAGVIDFILPPRCPNCACKLSAHGFLCPTCWGDLKPLAAPFCEQCALPFEFEASTGDVCGACLQAPPVYDWARAAVAYDDLGRDLVIRLKHSGSVAVVPAMAQMMVQALTGTDADILMPVPLHGRRMRARRFNQSQLLAGTLSKRLGVPMDTFSLKKTRATESQGGLGRKARFRNVASSFVVDPAKRPALRDKKILLVDDVLTTGATASTCAEALKKAGAGTVGIVAFARVGQPVAG